MAITRQQVLKALPIESEHTWLCNPPHLAVARVGKARHKHTPGTRRCQLAPHNPEQKTNENQLLQGQTAQKRTLVTLGLGLKQSGVEDIPLESPFPNVHLNLANLMPYAS